MTNAVERPDLMQAITSKMRYHTQRQKVLASNIANIDTPNFQAKDVKKPSFLDAVARETQSLQLTTTSHKHIGGGQRFDNPYRVESLRNPYEIAPNGNNVVLEEQMANLSDNTTQYEISSSLYKKYTMMMRSVLGQR
jgi:flagellar basal-body rod protein FlgB